MLSNVPISKDKENVDVESLSTSVPIKDTIDLIFEEISVHKKLEPICKKSMFIKLLYKLTTECTFSARKPSETSKLVYLWETHCQ